MDTALRLGPLTIWPPVVLAPMAGITSYPFRAICRGYGAGLYVSEMVSARQIALGGRKAEELSRFGPDEEPRSLQLYAVDPEFAGAAVARLVEENRVDHIDFNFGCPMPKITRKGGGAAIPLRPRLLESILGAAVQAAGSVPVTMKMRLGLNNDLLSYMKAGKIAQDCGCSAVALHARTAAELYGGSARWPAIAELKSALSIPVLGNGDVWHAVDARRMIEETGCDGVVIGRGCLGRPWLFRDLEAMFDGLDVPSPPKLGEVASMLIDYASRSVAWTNERRALLELRKHLKWALEPYPSGAVALPELMRSSSLSVLRLLLTILPTEEEALTLEPIRPRGKRPGASQKTPLPAGWLDGETAPLPGAEEALSGG